MKQMPPIKYISPRSDEYYYSQQRNNVLTYFSPSAFRQRRAERLNNSSSYPLIKGIATAMDTYMLDPIIGIFLPGFGDAICAALSLPFLWVSLFEIRSIALTLNVLKNILVDMCVGAIPAIGDIADFFIRNSRKNYRLIVGYAEGDSEVISEVRGNAVWIGILCIIHGIILYYLIKLVALFWGWISSGLSSLISIF